MIGELDDMKLLALAATRMSHYNPSKVIPQEAIDREFGFTPEDLAAMDEEEVELE